MALIYCGVSLHDAMIDACTSLHVSEHLANSTNDFHIQIDANYRHSIILSVATSNSAVP